MTIEQVLTIIKVTGRILVATANEITKELEAK